MNQIEFILSAEQQHLIQTQVADIVLGAIEQASKLSKYVGRDYLKKQEACDYLGITNNTLDKYIRQRGLKVSIIEGSVFISKKEIARFMSQYER